MHSSRQPLKDEHDPLEVFQAYNQHEENIQPLGGLEHPEQFIPRVVVSGSCPLIRGSANGGKEKEENKDLSY